ncbi:MAG: hypothetical protein AAB426_03160, partial [Myxococcota bacterium]
MLQHALSILALASLLGCVYEPRELTVPEGHCTLVAGTVALADGSPGQLVQDTSGSYTVLVAADEVATLDVTAACGTLAWDTSVAAGYVCNAASSACFVATDTRLLVHGVGTASGATATGTVSLLAQAVGQDSVAQRIDIVWLPGASTRAMFVDLSIETDGVGTAADPRNDLLGAIYLAGDELSIDRSTPYSIYVRGAATLTLDASLAIPQGLVLVGGLDGGWRPVQCHCLGYAGAGWVEAMDPAAWGLACAAQRLTVQPSGAFNDAALLTYEPQAAGVDTVLEGIALRASSLGSSMHLVSVDGASPAGASQLSLVRSSFELRDAHGAASSGGGIAVRRPVQLSFLDSEMLIATDNAQGVWIESADATFFASYSCISVASDTSSRGVAFGYSSPSDTAAALDVGIETTYVSVHGGTDAEAVSVSGDAITKVYGQSRL